MCCPPLLKGKTTAEYRSYYEATYCKGPITTFDGIMVRFRKRDFNHCFFESIKNKDDTFSNKRAERVLWIRDALKNPNAQLHVGWDKKKKKPSLKRRVAVVYGNYIVVIQIIGHQKANFITAFVADPQTINKIRTSPKWT